MTLCSILLVILMVVCQSLVHADSSGSDEKRYYNKRYTARRTTAYPSYNQQILRYYQQMYNMKNVIHRLQALEADVKSGAIGGCESGVIGPFSPHQRTGQIQFKSKFHTPPAVTLAVSDLNVIDPRRGVNFQIRPSALTTRSANVNFIDKGHNLASAFVSYMACPNNANRPTKTKTTTTVKRQGYY